MDTNGAEKNQKREDAQTQRINQEGRTGRARGKRLWKMGLVLLASFGVWTALIQWVDVQPWGQNGTNIGFAHWNRCFHRLTGINMTLYTVTDWLGLIPLVVCLCFAVLGAVQLIRRRSLVRVDGDILLLGGYYILVIFEYLFFEMYPINYRPILIDGFMEASYPSSTTLLVLGVLPTLSFQVRRRTSQTENGFAWRKATDCFAAVFSAFMVIGRLISGVHWFTDIIGSVLLSGGSFLLYGGLVLLYDSQAKSC